MENKNKNFDYNWIGDKNVDAPYQYLKMATCIIAILSVIFGVWYNLN